MLRNSSAVSRAVTQDRAQGADAYILVLVHRNGGAAAIDVTQDMMTAADAYDLKAGLLQSPDDS